MCFLIHRYREIEIEEQLKRVFETVSNRKTMKGNILGLEKHGIPASPRISKYL